MVLIEGYGSSHGVDRRLWGCHGVDRRLWGCHGVDRRVWGSHDVDRTSGMENSPWTHGLKKGQIIWVGKTKKYQAGKKITCLSRVWHSELYEIMKTY